MVQKESGTSKSKKEGKSSDWETVPDPSAYSIDEFYCRASDKRGHSAQMYVRIPPEVMALCEQIMESKKFVYRTYGEMIRDSLVHRVSFLRQKAESGKLDEAFLRVLAIEQIVKQEELDSEFRSIIHRLDTVIEERLKDSPLGREEAVSIIQGVLDNVNAMPEGYRRRQYSSAIHGKYDYLLKGDKGR